MATFKRAGVIAKHISSDLGEYYLCVLGDEAGKWGFPKGHIEQGEDPIECATRECLEETGIQVKLDGEIGFTGKHAIYYFHKMYLFYLI